MNRETINFIYTPTTEHEQFGVNVYKLIVENFSQTFFVGGMVRDLLLKKNVDDIDIATEATPDQVIDVLERNAIPFDDAHAQFGVITAYPNGAAIEVTTMRQETYSENRYPETKFITDVWLDSTRRDFTVNALYLSQKDDEVFDFHGGLGDLGSKTIRFIGDAEQKVLEDPLRIVRALRFALVLKFTLHNSAVIAIKKYFSLIKNISHSLIEKESKKISDIQLQKKFFLLLDDEKLLDTIA